MTQVDSKTRVWAMLIYMASLTIVHAATIDSSFAPGPDEIWLFNGIAGLLLGSQLLNPHFTPPADSATNAFVAASTLLAALAAVPDTSTDVAVAWLGIAGLGGIFLGAVGVLALRRPRLEEFRPWMLATERAVRALGNPTVVFTLVIVISCWLFHRQESTQVFAILTSWTVIVALRPIESIAAWWAWFSNKRENTGEPYVVGHIAAHQTPNLILIRQSAGTGMKTGTPLIVSGPLDQPYLGISLNYVGRDEGDLLRVAIQQIPREIREQVPKPIKSLAFRVEIGEDAAKGIPILHRLGSLCGIVDSDTNTEFLQIEIINQEGLAEGRLVETFIGEKNVLYQIIDGVTREDIVQHKNKYGYARATARKIGSWDHDKEQFKPVPWIPKINQPVFLLEDAEFGVVPWAVGHFPRTRYPVAVNIADAVTHNTAILGILGIGKTYLAVELVERMIASGIKVICLDLTNQYETLLEDCIDQDYAQAQFDELAASGEGGTPHRIKERGGSINAFREKMLEQTREFLADSNPGYLRVINPARLTVTRQASGMFQDEADMATLSACEITAIVSDVALSVCQELGMTDEGRVCLVYEEAHSLVPEWNSVAQEGDRTATAASARAILQGRKYGLGTLLITQRTANVTKTILNQCNTIFAMRTFDDTGKDFLSNFIGGEYARVLPSLRERHAVVFGKASSCDNPVAIRLNDRDAFKAAFNREHPPVKPRYKNDSDDDIPF